MVYIKRELEKDLLKFIKAPEILAVLGARQVGKTTLVNNILQSFTKKRIKKITLDNVEILDLFVNDTDSFIKLYLKDVDVLFIDELHYAKDGGKILKFIYDTTKNKKIIISGSSAIDLSIQSLKYLVGRVINFELYSFSFLEFLRSKNNNLAELYLSLDYKEPILKKLNKYFEEYLIYGGYPRIALEKDIKNKQKLLTNIYNTYALREIKELEDIKDDFKLHKLIKALSLQIGNLIDYSELKNISGYHHNQLKEVLNILEKTYICKQLSPYYTNKRTELVKSKMIYFYDLGLRNSIINDYSLDRSDLGAIKENFILSELIRSNRVVKYWRTKSGAESDFIIENGKEIIPIEVKSNLKNTNFTKSMISFIGKYSPKKAFVISNIFEGKRKLYETDVIFLPFVKFLPNIDKYLK
jgi:uncharacterized protein